MLSERQIKDKKLKLLQKKREATIAKRNCKQYSRSWNKHNTSIIKITAELKVIREILRGRKLDYKPLKSRKAIESYKTRMNKIKSLVQSTLREDYASRDDDNLLCIRVWEKQGLKPKMKVDRFEELLITGQLGIPESITRSRRMLQVKHESLRGDLYEERRKAETTFTDQLKLEFNDIY